MEPSDHELASRIAEQDPGALEICYDRHAGRVLGLLLKLVGNREDAEDLLQATFLEAWRFGHQYDPSRSRLDAWLLLIARSRALDHLRRRRPIAEVAAVGVCEPSSSGGPPEDFERVEAGLRLRDALQQLPQDQSQAIRFAFLAGLTHAEIARRLEVPLGTIKTRIRLGMNRLRDILQEQER
jgi:RNA polymerase sigma-70 factor (ECF subfamily)